MSSNPPKSPLKSRKSHRKRISALRLSVDTASTLPEYNSAGWLRSLSPEQSDRPPDYPDSAEEGDEDTDNSDIYVPPPSLPPSLPASPRRPRRYRDQLYRTRSNNSNSGSNSTDAYLDALLERSVHALEMSNALLQSSISTQSTLSSIMNRSDSTMYDQALETRAQNLSLRINGTKGMHKGWADDLDEISRGVEGLFGEEERGNGLGLTLDDVGSGSVSSSLPPSSSISPRRKAIRRPSLDMHAASTSSIEETPHLTLAAADRIRLVSPPPRALTQYVGSTADPNSITLPSTLGLRSSTHSYPSPHSPNAPLVSQSTPIRIDAPLSIPSEPSTPAYTALSTYLSRTQSHSSGSSTPSTSVCISPTRPSSLFGSRRGRSSSAGSSTERGSNYSRSRPSLSRISTQSPERSRPSRPLTRPGTSATPSPTSHRPMTPPIEEQSASESSSSDNRPRAQLTVQSLRKILDDQAAKKATRDSSPTSIPSATSSNSASRLRPPMFNISSSAPSSGTSNATASVSKLFTKAVHSSSTRAPSPPKQSSLKPSSASGSGGSASGSATHTPRHTPSPSLLHIPDILAIGMGLGSGPSSGRSTPKRISFAELPESYAGSRPEGAPSKFKEKKGRRKRSKSLDSISRTKGDGKEPGWWMTWLIAAAAPGPVTGYGGRGMEDRMEDRLSRGWGARPGFGSGVDDWGS